MLLVRPRHGSGSGCRPLTSTMPASPLSWATATMFACFCIVTHRSPSWPFAITSDRRSDTYPPRTSRAGSVNRATTITVRRSALLLPRLSCVFLTGRPARASPGPARGSSSTCAAQRSLPDEHALALVRFAQHDVLGKRLAGRGSAGSAIDSRQARSDALPLLHLGDRPGYVLVQGPQRPGAEEPFIGESPSR